MKEIFRRLRQRPALATELLLLSFAANLLALASPIFVMLVLGRYVTHGVDSTLVTLFSGVVIAIFMEFAIRSLRLRLSRALSQSSDLNLSIGSFGLLINMDMSKPTGIEFQEIPSIQRHLDTISNAYGAINVCAVLDFPFAILFLSVLFILNVPLGIVATLFILGTLALRFANQKLRQKQMSMLEPVQSQATGLFNNAIRSPDTVRLFDPSGWLINKWSKTATEQINLRSNLGQTQGFAETSTASLQILLGAVIIAFGATFVVSGDLNVSSLIGANILAARAYSTVSKFTQLSEVFGRARTSIESLKTLANYQASEGQTIPANPIKGAIELRNLSFAHPGMPIPLYEQMSVTLAAGQVMIIAGANGVGKTTLIRLILGLLTPDKGQIFADGIDTRQISPKWWREQVAYLPQEPWFFDGTIRENIQLSRPNMDEAAMTNLFGHAGLKKFIEENINGADLMLSAGGANLAVGIRKRLAIARMLSKNAPIVILDEPAEGMDAEGVATIHKLLDDLSRVRRTTIIVSNDPELIKRAHVTINVGQPKPTDSKPSLRLSGADE